MNHLNFIENLFKDKEIKEFYVIPEELNQNYRKLVDYWLRDISRNRGYAWIIYKRGTGLFQLTKPCGFIVFEFYKTYQRVRISYAMKPNFRNQGIMYESLKLVLDKLKSIEVDIVEADIDNENSASQKLIKKLGFETDTKTAYVDPVRRKNGEMRFRYLWRKSLFDYSKLDFFYVDNNRFYQIITSKTIFKLQEEEISDSTSFFMAQFNMRKTGKYHFVFQTEVTEKLVGISNKDNVTYNRLDAWYLTYIRQNYDISK